MAQQTNEAQIAEELVRTFTREVAGEWAVASEDLAERLAAEDEDEDEDDEDDEDEDDDFDEDDEGGDDEDEEEEAEED